MFWDRSQIAIVSAFDKEYILYCVNIAFGHDPKNHLSKFLRFCLGTIPNDHLGPIPRIIQSCFRARSQNFPRELFKLVLGILPFLNQRKGENDRRKYFMINLHERMLPTSTGVEPSTSWSPVGRRIQLSHRGRQ